MLLSKSIFENKVSDLGIKSNDIIIVYCKEGVLSSPRVWWMFKYFGHKKVFILNGGFKAWAFANGEIISGPEKIKQTKYKVGRVKKKLNFTYEELLHIKKQKRNYSILDARPTRRFFKLDPEPRKNIGKGNIKGSKNLEFSLLELNGFFKTKSEG